MNKAQPRAAPFDFSKGLAFNILRVTALYPKICNRFLANSVIALDHRGVGYPLVRYRPGTSLTLQRDYRASTSFPNRLATASAGSKGTSTAFVPLGMPMA